MNKLEVFFDYACPFCLKGHEYLSEMLPLPKEIEIEWHPCEAHPRPDKYGPHSDLCIQGMFYALDHGVDIMAYHELMYRAALTDRIDIENLDVLANYVSALLDADDFRVSVKTGAYKKALDDSNDYAYEQSGVWTVPAYRMNGQKLDSAENVGVTKKQLESFILRTNNSR